VLSTTADSGRFRASSCSFINMINKMLNPW
jgi:hypothetical protein